jgi:hypothetical protein
MLTVLDFFKLLGTRKAKQRVLQDAHTKNKFLVWAQANEHYARRIGRRSDWTVSLRRAKTLQSGLTHTYPHKHSHARTQPLPPHHTQRTPHTNTT